jgi:HNH endonuclease
MNCLYCHQPLIRKTNERAVSFERRKYCNYQCVADGRRKHDASRTAFKRHYRKFKKLNCERCNATGKLSIHHLDRNFRNNDPSNLQTLCGSCHSLLHHTAGECPGPKRRGHPPCFICGAPSHAKRLCGLHYQQLRRGPPC